MLSLMKAKLYDCVRSKKKYKTNSTHKLRIKIGGQVKVFLQIMLENYLERLGIRNRKHLFAQLSKDAMDNQ